MAKPRGGRASGCYQGASGPSKVNLYDIQGRARGQWSVESGSKLKVGFSDLPAGYYILTVETQQNTVYRRRVFKQR